jgi:hypothetical protein
MFGFGKKKVIKSFDDKFQVGKIQKGGVNEKPEYTQRPAPPKPQLISNRK